MGWIEFGGRDCGYVEQNGWHDQKGYKRGAWRVERKKDTLIKNSGGGIKSFRKLYERKDILQSLIGD